jgi:hypothetical protein
MSRKGCTRKKILQALRQADDGGNVTAICRKLRISE